MSRDQKGTCRNCDHWCEHDNTQDDDPDFWKGDCRLNGPICVGGESEYKNIAMWPMTRGGDWCSRFLSKPLSGEERKFLGELQGASPDGDRALASEAPTGLHPSDVDPLREAEPAVDYSVELTAYRREMRRLLLQLDRRDIIDAVYKAIVFSEHEAARLARRDRDRNPKGGDFLGSVVDESPVSEGKSPESFTSIGDLSTKILSDISTKRQSS